MTLIGSISAAVLFGTLLISLLASARGNLSDFFMERLRNIPASYQDTGSICERVAELELAGQYKPPQYRIESGVQYSNGQRTLGELDLIITNGRDEALLVIEVKCWSSPDGGLKKAREQARRFVDNVRSGRRLYFMRGNQSVPNIDFSQIQNFKVMGQLGVKAHGYDLELPLPLNALMGLRQEMINCQNRGDCARP
jgi:hypothetical protein